MNSKCYTDALDEIRNALISDRELNFKRDGKYLRYGVCPQCGKPEVFVNLDKPFRISCGRLNNCGWSVTPRELYPEIFENFSKHHPTTQQNPNATADAYMSEVRGFDLKIIKGMYHQGVAKNTSKDEYYPAVCIDFAIGKRWMRIINDADIKKFGAKTKINAEYKGEGWIPPNMTFKTGDTVYIVEGIFKAMALLHIGKKAIASLSSYNFPWKILEENKKKSITWVIALDSDRAGITETKKYAAEAKKRGYTCRVIFPESGKDWDDVFRDGNLNEYYLQESEYRGYYLLAETLLQKAFFWWCRNHREYHIFDFHNALYRLKVDQKKMDSETEFHYPDSNSWYITPEELGSYLTKFSNIADIREICPAKPQFLYLEHNILTKEVTDNFFVEFKNEANSKLIASDGTIFKSADNFSNFLLKETGFIPFYGSNEDLRILHSMWFSRIPKNVKAVPYMGYEPESKIYVFPNFAYSAGQYQEMNQYGFVSYGKQSMKCALAGLDIVKKPDEFTGSWLPDFAEAFDNNGLVLLAWWTGTLFAEQIRQKHGQWPFLEYTGAPGAGKTTQLNFMWKLMGIDHYEGLDPNHTTTAGVAREMTKLSNLPVIMLEADRKDVQKAVTKMYNFSELKPFFNSGAVVRSTGVKNGGYETHQLIFRGGILISQNAEVVGEDALLSRIVHCNCTQDHFTARNAGIADKLKEMTGKELGSYLHVCLRKEKELLAEYRKNFEICRTEFNDRNKMREVKELRIRETHAQVAAWMRTLPLIFGDKMPDQMVESGVDHLWKRAISRQTRLQSDPPYLQQFWEIYDFLHTQRDANGKTFEILNHSSNPDLIAISLPHFREIAQNRKQEIPPLTELPPLFRVGKRHKLIGNKNVNSQLEHCIRKCWVFEAREGGSK